MFSDKWEHVYFKSFHVLSKNFVPYKKTKKHEKLTIFRLFWFATFHFSFFFLHFFIHCLELMKSVSWEVGTCFFHKFSCLKWKFRTVQNTKKTWKINDFSTFLDCNFSLFIFFSTFHYLLLRNDKNCFLRSGDMFFFRSFHVLIKNFVPYKTQKKTWIINDFSTFWFATFHFSFFFYISLISA